MEGDDGPAARTPLQELVSERLTELGLSYRRAAERSRDLIHFSTFSRLAGKERWAGRVTARTVAGLALALDLPESRVRKAVEETLRQEEFAELDHMFRSLSPTHQSQIVKLMHELHKAEQKQRAAKAKLERPYGGTGRT